jgi:tetratricopeptide (TPR) repeat protein
MGAAASTIPPLPFDPHTFPRYGVRLSFLNLFLEECGGRSALEDLTTTEVCERFIKPVTESSESSYCDFLRELKHEAVGEATVFISHAWKYKFLDVVDSLSHHFLQTPDVVVWFDLFSNNQHKAIELDFSYWANTFQSAIQSFGHTVMVLAPWDNPIPLTRAWCLWELYCTAQTQSKFEVAMTGSARMHFIDDILEDGVGSIGRMLSQIDVKNSECFKPEDRTRIFEAIENSIGFSELNQMVFERLRDWVIVAMREETTNDKNSTDVRYLDALARIYQDQGNYAEAEPLLLKCLGVRLQVLGENHADTLSSMNNLAALYHSQGKYAEAEPLYVKYLSFGFKNLETLTSMNNLAELYRSQGKYAQAEPLFLKCLEVRQEVLGEQHPGTLTSMNNLAAFYLSQGKSTEAETLFVKCLELIRELLGDKHPNTLQSMNNLAELYRRQKKYAEAEPLLVKCLELIRELLGDKHPNTLQSMNNLAELYRRQKKYAEAEPLLLKCLELTREVLGDKHPNTLTSMSSLAVLYLSQGKYAEAEPLFVECLDVRGEVLGKDHPDTLTAMKNLAAMYLGQELSRRGATCEYS